MERDIVESLLKVGKLKSLKRTGWVREGMPDPESVAEHCFRVAFLALIVGGELKGVDTDRLIKMALLHDSEEAFTGDPVTERFDKQVGVHDHVSESEIVKDMFSGFEQTDELHELWSAHLPETGPEATREANILYQIGKIATAWQALEYELAGEDPKIMDEWWVNARKHVTEPILEELLTKLESKRKNGQKA